MLRPLVAPLVTALALTGCTTGSEGSGGAGGAGAAASSTSSKVSASTSSSDAATSGSPTSSSTSSGTGGLGSELCPTDGPPVGIDVGQRLPSIEVLTCDDVPFNLDDLCGAEELWVFAAHGWCPLCQSVSSKQEAWLDEYAPKGLVAVNILVADGQGNPPTAAFCKQWRDTYGHADVIQLYDPTGAVLQLWPGGSSSLSAFVDKDRVIQSKLVHTSDEATIRANIEALLPP